VLTMIDEGELDSELEAEPVLVMTGKAMEGPFDIEKLPG
jgi:hypothetical protein